MRSYYDSLKDCEIEQVEILAEKINHLALTLGEGEFDNLRASLALEFGIDEYLELEKVDNYDDGDFYVRFNLPNFKATLIVWWNDELGIDCRAELHPWESFLSYKLDNLAAKAIKFNSWYGWLNS